jgi:hypothetical protein
MKMKRITSLLLITIQSISLLSVVQFTTSCGTNYEIIVHANTQAEANEGVARYLYENKTSSMRIINFLFKQNLYSSYYVTDIIYDSTNYVLQYKTYAGSSESVIIDTPYNAVHFNLERRMDENNLLFSFWFQWETHDSSVTLGVYRAYHDIFIDYTGDGELV